MRYGGRPDSAKQRVWPGPRGGEWGREGRLCADWPKQSRANSNIEIQKLFFKCSSEYRQLFLVSIDSSSPSECACQILSKSETLWLERFPNGLDRVVSPSH